MTGMSEMGGFFPSGIAGWGAEHPLDKVHDDHFSSLPSDGLNERQQTIESLIEPDARDR